MKRATRLIGLNAAVLAGLLAECSFAAEVEIPAGAVGDRTQMVLWADGSQFTPDKFRAVENSVKDMMPEAERAAAHRKVEMFQKLATGLVGIGVESLVVSSKQSPMNGGEAANAAPAPKEKVI